MSATSIRLAFSRRGQPLLKRTPLIVSLGNREQTPSVEQTEARWFAEEVCPHEPALRAWLRARFPSLTDIDDLVQETYARLFRARSSGQVGEVRPFLFVIARYAAVDVLRHSQIIAFDRLEVRHISESEEAPCVEEYPSIDLAGGVSRDGGSPRHRICPVVAAG